MASGGHHDGCQSASFSSARDLECAICLDMPHNPTSLDCGHLFCNSCLQKLFKTSRGSVACPICKTKQLTPFNRLPVIIGLKNYFENLNPIPSSSCEQKLLRKLMADFSTSEVNGYFTARSAAMREKRQCVKNLVLTILTRCNFFTELTNWLSVKLCTKILTGG